jgi:hypothetical protein
MLSAQSNIPHLQMQGTATQLIVDGKPFLSLGGELRNSSTSSLEYMKPIWGRMVGLNINTVLAPVTWETLEPEEGKLNFSLVDGLIRGCAAARLAAGDPLVWNLEERHVQLRAALGQAGLRAVPPRPGAGGGKR